MAEGGEVEKFIMGSGGGQSSKKYAYVTSTYINTLKKKYNMTIKINYCML